MSIINAVLHLVSHRRGNPQRQRALHRRLGLESLEQRTLFSVMPLMTATSPVPHQSITAIVNQEAELSASDGQLNGTFGTSVATDGGTVVVGAMGDNCGKVYVFTEGGAGSNRWTQAAELKATDGRASNDFGMSVAISGNTIVVGAPDAASGDGEAYVFTKGASGWANMTQSAILTVAGLVPSDCFGMSVGISGGTIVVGEEMIGTGAGAAYVFTGAGAAWTETAKLTASNGTFDDCLGSSFGGAVAISGNTIAVGAQMADCNRGEVCVYTRSGSAWSQVAILTASDGSDPGGTVYGDQLGDSVSISGNTVVAGAPYATVGSPAQNQRGAAYVFTEPASGWMNMTQTVKLTAADGPEYSDFGMSVGISGGTIAVGSWSDTMGNSTNQGSAYVFTEPVSGWANVATATKLLASDGEAYDYFGTSIAVGGGLIAVGAPQYGPVPDGDDPPNGSDGAAYVFAAAVPVVTPTIVSGVSTTAAANTQEAVGATVSITVAFSAAVSVTGTPQLALNDGGVAKYVSGNGTSTLIFNYVVAAGQNTPDLDYASTTALSLNGGSIKDASGNAAVLTLPATGSDSLATKKIAVNSTAMIIAVSTTAPANSQYTAGRTISITVTFNEAVNVSGTPQLKLNDGGVAKYTGGSGTSAITFTYVVAAGQKTSDLDYASTAALVLNGGGIKDTTGHAAVLTLPATGTDNLATKKIVIK
jgi:hypothetical protein